jgi:hypothetical protein
MESVELDPGLADEGEHGRTARLVRLFLLKIGDSFLPTNGRNHDDEPQLR